MISPLPDFFRVLYLLPDQRLVSPFMVATAIMTRFGGPSTMVRSTMPSLMPTFTLAAMVLIIKILAINLTTVVPAPIRISSVKIIPVMGILPIPRIPLRSIPLIGSGDIGGSIGVIRRPSVPVTEKVM